MWFPDGFNEADQVASSYFNPAFFQNPGGFNVLRRGFRVTMKVLAQNHVKRKLVDVIPFTSFQPHVTVTDNIGDVFLCLLKVRWAFHLRKPLLHLVKRFFDEYGNVFFLTC